MSEITGQNQFERAHNMLELPDARKTKPATILELEPLLGLQGTYIVQTVRRPEETGYTVLLTIVNSEGTFRHVLPDRVCGTIESQRRRLLGPVRAPKRRLTADERKSKELRRAKRLIREENARRRASR